MRRNRCAGCARGVAATARSMGAAGPLPARCQGLGKAPPSHLNAPPGAANSGEGGGQRGGDAPGRANADRGGAGGGADAPARPGHRLGAAPAGAPAERLLRSLASWPAWRGSDPEQRLGHRGGDGARWAVDVQRSGGGNDRAHSPPGSRPASRTCVSELTRCPRGRRRRGVRGAGGVRRQRSSGPRHWEHRLPSAGATGAGKTAVGKPPRADRREQGGATRGAPRGDDRWRTRW
jgi:hypothetical protein